MGRAVLVAVDPQDGSDRFYAAGGDASSERLTAGRRKNRDRLLLVGRFGGDWGVQFEPALEQWGERTAVIRIQLERITGKAHRLTAAT